jgi:glucans biosynthesis protein
MDLFSIFVTAQTRRAILAQMAMAVAMGARAQTSGGPALGPPAPFSFEALKAQAERLARRPYVPRRARLTDTLQALDFDAIGQIRYRPEAALWRDLPGDSAVEFFHLGRYARTPVAIHVVEGGLARDLIYSKALFEIPPGGGAAHLPDDLGFAGFRVMNRNGPGDWIAYLGASYFRAAAPFNQYGLSARGLAVDTASSAPEEFPSFTSFWLGHDGAGDLVVCALLDGPSVAGAYRISHHKTDAAMVQKVEAALWFRGGVQRLGVAPLTSMYWYGQTERAKAIDWRPQIHDSDGLAMWTGAGERIWRPLANPPRVVTNAFQDTDPRGFGLMQRDRAFADYQDDGAFYNRRPSLWVEPVGRWGAGSVQLVEIPTGSEIDDNIVAFWTPTTPAAAGQRLDLAYRLYWGDEEPTPVGVARVTATREGLAGRPGQPSITGARKFVIDFSGGRLDDLNRASGVQPVVNLSHGAPLAAAAYPIAGASGWRLMFDAALPAGNTLDLRAFLRLDGEALTETWVGQAFG